MDDTDESHTDEYMVHGMEPAEGSNAQQQQQQPRPSSSPADSSASLRSQVHKGRTRTTIVCAECKRLKLGCDRQRPCSKCVLRDTIAKCVYDPTAEGKIDVHTIHRAQLSDRNLLLGIADTIGISEEERNIVVGADGWPPYEGFQFTIDPTRIRTMLGMELSADASSGLDDLARQSFPMESVPLVAFSKPPAQAVLNPLPTRQGHIPRPTPASRRPRTARREDSTQSSSDAQRMLALASCAFQANSITVPIESTSHLRQNCSSLGWEPQVSYPSAAVVSGASTSQDASKPNMKEPARNIFRLAPRHSEIDFHDAPRPKDTLVMSLAYQLFVMPGMAPSISPENPPPTPSPSQPPPLLVTPRHVKHYLPSLPWRSRLWDEFESLMVIHDGMGGSGKVRWLRKRIDKMFEWADLAPEADQRVPAQDAARDSWSTYTPSSLSSSSSRPGPSLTSGSRSRKDTNEVPPPPTLALFAAASAVFSLGALNYECRIAHEAVAGSVLMDTTSGSNSVPNGGRTIPHPKPTSLPISEASSYSVLGAEMPSITLPTQNPSYAGDPAPQSAKPDVQQPQLPETPNSHVLHSLSRACIFAHNALDLPPSLDYLYAHMLNWTFLLHPSNSLSSTNHAGDGADHGITAGTVCQVEQSIWKELGGCVNVARTMGLSIVDEVGSGSFGHFSKEGKESVEDEAMSPWEREMRRRVWWMLVLFDLKISECMGHSPLIAPNPSSCKPPSEVDDSNFDPTSTSLPLTTPGGTNNTFFVLKCRLAILMAFQHQQTFRDPRTGNLSKIAAHSFASRVTMWLDALPEEFKISFGQTAEETDFPESDITSAQACDLHIQADLMFIRLWYPFLADAFAYPSLPESQNILQSCASSAKAIIVASHHALQRFRKIRPLAFGHYGFGHAIYLASTLLCNMLVAAPNVMFASTAKNSVETAIMLLDDSVLAGTSDINGGCPSAEAATLKLLLNQAKACQDRMKPSAKGKRKVEMVTHVQPVRTGRQVLYTGLDAASVLGPLEFGLPPIQATQSAFTNNIDSHLINLTLDEMTGPRMKHPLAARKESLASRAAAAAAPPEINPDLPPATGTPPLLATITSRKSGSRAASVASHVAASQLSRATTSPEVIAPRDKPTFGVRTRMKTTGNQGKSSLSATSSPPDAPSDSKRLKQVGRNPSAGPSTSNDGPSQSASPMVPQPSIAYKPPSLHGSPLPLPEINRNAAPQPTHAQPPDRLPHPQQSSMPDTSHHPRMYRGIHASDSPAHYSIGQPSLDLWTPLAGTGTGASTGTPDLDIISQERQAFNNPIPPPLSSGFMHHQLQQQQVSLGYDPMSSVAIHQTPIETAYDRSIDVPSSSHAISFGNGGQLVYGVPVRETLQALPRMHTPLTQQRYTRPQQVQAQAPQFAMGHQVPSTIYAAPQHTMQEQQPSQPPPQQMAFAPQYSIAQHPLPPLLPYQDTTQYGGGVSIIQQEWTSDTQPTVSDASHTQHTSQPPPWPNQYYPPSGGY